MRILALALVLAPAAVSAATLGEEKRFVVNTISPTDFEVIEQQQMGPAEFWCAAASYHEVRRGRPETMPIYIRRPRGGSVTQPGAKGVVFTLDPVGLPPAGQRLSVTVDDPGATLKSAQARRFCRDAFTRSTK